MRASWTPDKQWTARLAILDGVPGVPGRERLFVGARLAPRDGTLVIGQVDYRWSEDGRVALGAWRYSHVLPGLDGGPARHDKGFYVEVESLLPGSKHWSGWLRYGVAAGSVQPIDGYLGGGFVGKGLLRGRPEDRLGLAMARASISDAAMRAEDLPDAETTFEASYQIKLSAVLAVQPDLQYVVHPAAVAAAPDAFVAGLRLVISLGGPKPAPATDASDTTVPSDTPDTKDNDGK
jgi:porin